MSRVPAQVQARVPSPATSILGGRSRDATLIPATWLTDFYALPMAPSLHLMLRMRARVPARVPLFLPAFASTPQGRSRQLPLTLAMCRTDFCVLQMAL